MGLKNNHVFFSHLNSQKSVTLVVYCHGPYEQAHFMKPHNVSSCVMPTMFLRIMYYFCRDAADLTQRRSRKEGNEYKLKNRRTHMNTAIPGTFKGTGASHVKI